MCEIVGTTLATLFAGGSAATAAGATAGAATGLAGALQTIGTIVSIGGTIAGGIAANDAARDHARQLEEQARQEAVLNSIEDQRVRKEMAGQIRQQAAQIADRGFSLSSPTAVYLGQTAARELAFASQSVRQTGAARQTELTNQARAVRAQGKQAMFKGGISAAGTLLKRAPDLWPELLS